MILALVYDDGSKRVFKPNDSVRSVIGALQRGEVETIVAGDVSDEKVLWEKQFNACTVMPIEFGGRPKKGKNGK